MKPLTSKQRAFLRARAHRLTPVVHVGSSGVTDAVLAALDDAFATRELLKVKASSAAPEGVDRTADALRDAGRGAHVVQTIGRTVVLYRPFDEDPELVLP